MMFGGRVIFHTRVLEKRVLEKATDHQERAGHMNTREKIILDRVNRAEMIYTQCHIMVLILFRVTWKDEK